VNPKTFTSALLDDFHGKRRAAIAGYERFRNGLRAKFGKDRTSVI